MRRTAPTRADQQPRALQGDEALVLEHLHPEHPRLSMRLPAIRPTATVTRGSAREDVALACDTLWLDTDRGIGALVWRGWVRLRSQVEDGAVVVCLERGAPSAEAAAATMAAGLVVTGQALPFRDAAAIEEGEGGDEDAASTEARPALQPAAGAMTVAAALVAVPAEEVLPFREGPPAAIEGPANAEPRPTSSVAEPEPKTARTGTIAVEDEAGRAASPEPGRAPPVPRRRGATLELAPEAIAAAAAAGVLPFEALPPEARAQAARDAVPAPAPEAPAVRALETVQPPTEPIPPLPPLPAPPPMIGPLARPAWDEEKSAAAPESAGAAPPAPEAPDPAPAKEEPPGLPLDRYPLERCAAIAASIARRREDKDRILEENELSNALWEDLKKHWDGEIGKENRAGMMRLMRRYDAAYVAQLEKERGAIGIQEYARIVIAVERGSSAETLGVLGLPGGTAMRLDRLWMERSASDPAVGRAIQEAIRVARHA